MDFLRELGIQETNSGAYCGEWLETSGELLESRSPATGELLATVKQATAEEYDQVVAAAEEAFLRWRELHVRIKKSLSVCVSRGFASALSNAGWCRGRGGPAAEPRPVARHK